MKLPIIREHYVSRSLTIKEIFAIREFHTYKQLEYYTQNRNDNFFLPPSLETVNDFKNANGQEFGNGIDPGKIKALHSSSALAVNFFEYWKASSDKQY